MAAVTICSDSVTLLLCKYSSFLKYLWKQCVHSTRISIKIKLKYTYINSMCVSAFWRLSSIRLKGIYWYYLLGKIDFPITSVPKESVFSVMYSKVLTAQPSFIFLHLKPRSRRFIAQVLTENKFSHFNKTFHFLSSITVVIHLDSQDRWFKLAE